MIMFETFVPAYDFSTARRICVLLNAEGIGGVAEEHEIGIAHIRIDPEADLPTGWLAMAADRDDFGDHDAGWVMIVTHFDQDLHTYEISPCPVAEYLDLPLDADPDEVAEAITNFLS
jgi:hypothetical protein